MKYLIGAALLSLIVAALVYGFGIGMLPAGRPASQQPSAAPTAAGSEALEVAPAASNAGAAAPLPAAPTAVSNGKAIGGGATATPAATPSPKPRAKQGPFVVVVDPGHGSRFNYGAVYNFGGGVTLEERDLALKIGLKLAKLLEARGYKAILTRTKNGPVNANEDDLNGDGKVDNADELQARVDLANAADADLFLSIHFNGNMNRRMHGTETYYCEDRPFAAESKRFAEMVQQNVVDSLRAAGKEANDNGVKDDQLAGSGPGHLVVLGPGRPPRGEASKMPGALSEAVFLSSDLESTWLREPGTIDLLTNAYLKAIVAYFQSAA